MDNISLEEIQKFNYMSVFVPVFLYSTLGLLIGSKINKMFPKYNPDSSVLSLYIETTVQIIVNILFLFLFKKVIDIFIKSRISNLLSGYGFNNIWSDMNFNLVSIVYLSLLMGIQVELKRKLIHIFT